MNLKNKILSWCLKKFKSNMEDQQKVQQKVNELNNGLEKKVWKEAEGNHAVTKVEGIEGDMTFYPSVGVPIKLFVNQETGELKIFVAQMFKY